MVVILEEALLGGGEREAVMVGVLAGDAVRLAGALPVFSALGCAVCQRGCAEIAEFVVHAKGAGFAIVV